MPIQAPQWTDYLNCPVCCREFGAPPRSPISLSCGHTLCRHCLKHLHRKQCPFDQTVIQLEPEELVENTALLQLAGYAPPAQPYHPPSIQALPETDRKAYDLIVRSLEHLAVYLKYCGNVNNSIGGSRLSRPMQRKLVTLLQCSITDDEGRGRAARAARSLGERTVTELILQHQNPQQLSANLWAAVRARGCQFLGPAMQEEVLKLVLLALEDGSALSRKVLVMFVVQRLEPHFPQASKTSIGHVVQLLYRASCFKVSKRESESSLMQLKEEFRTYDSLRREHDAQIVQIATESGLRIAPDQWSALLYGDTAHKSHMQSIIDKLQTPQSFAQSVQELFIALQRTGDPAQLVLMSMNLDKLANIDPSPDAKSPSWQHLALVMTSLKDVVSGLVHYLQQQATGRDANHNQKHNTERGPDVPNHNSTQPGATTPTHGKYKMVMCRDIATKSFCPRGNNCNYAHSEEEIERYRVISMNGHIPSVPGQPPMNPPISGVAPGFAQYPHPNEGAYGGAPGQAPQGGPQHPQAVPPMAGIAPMPMQGLMPGMPPNMHQNTQGMVHQGQPMQGQQLHGPPMNAPPMQGVPMQGMPMQGPMMHGPPMQMPQMPGPQIPGPPMQSPPGLGGAPHEIPEEYANQGYGQAMMNNVPQQHRYDPNMRFDPNLGYENNHHNVNVRRRQEIPLFGRPEAIYASYMNAHHRFRYPYEEVPSQQEVCDMRRIARNTEMHAHVQAQAHAHAQALAQAQERARVEALVQAEVQAHTANAGFAPIQLERISEPGWAMGAMQQVPSTEVYSFDGLREALPVVAHPNDPNYPNDRRVVGVDRMPMAMPMAMPIQMPVNRQDDIDAEDELEEELLALERRIDTEFKNTD